MNFNEIKFSNCSVEFDLIPSTSKEIPKIPSDAALLEISNPETTKAHSGYIIRKKPRPVESEDDDDNSESCTIQKQSISSHHHNPRNSVASLFPKPITKAAVEKQHHHDRSRLGISEDRSHSNNSTATGSLHNNSIKKKSVFKVNDIINFVLFHRLRKY